MSDEIIQKVRHIIQARLDDAHGHGDFDIWFEWDTFKSIFEYAVAGKLDNLEQFDYMLTAEEVEEEEREWG